MLEYKVEQVKNLNNAVFSFFKDGWDIVKVEPKNNQEYILYMKREKVVGY